MDTKAYLDAVAAPGINVIHVQWTTDVKPAAAHRSHMLRKVSSATVLTGIEYANLSVNNDTETGDLPWGEWAKYPHIIQHKGVQYARLYTVDGTVRTTYMVDGDVVDRDTFNGFLTPSAAAAKRPNGGCITVKMDNVKLVGEPSFA
jgi:hypothetical protein